MEYFYNSLYERRLSLLHSKESEHEIMHKLFSVALPELRPQSVSHFLTILRDKRIKNLRERINEATQTGEEIDSDFGRQMLLAARKAEVPVKKAHTVIKWVGRVMSQIPIPGANLPFIVAEDIAETFATKSLTQQYQWLYCLLDAKEKHPTLAETALS
jgi:hypothetical protein